MEVSQIEITYVIKISITLLVHQLRKFTSLPSLDDALGVQNLSSILKHKLLHFVKISSVTHNFLSFEKFIKPVATNELKLSLIHSLPPIIRKLVCVKLGQLTKGCKIRKRKRTTI